MIFRLRQAIRLWLAADRWTNHASLRGPHHLVPTLAASLNPAIVVCDDHMEYLQVASIVNAVAMASPVNRIYFRLVE